MADGCQPRSKRCRIQGPSVIRFESNVTDQLVVAVMLRVSSGVFRGAIFAVSSCGVILAATR
jgi:hypothetical protein